MATPADLPRSVLGFLREHVDHVVKLRFLLVLHSAPSGTTTFGLVARAIDVPKRQIRDMANELLEEGLVRVSAEHIELAPRSIDDRLAISDLADCYAKKRDAVMEAMRALGRADGA
jgi:DNA-binding IclR family transcriptional regulator